MKKRIFWSRTVVITSKDENLTKSHVRYLESRILALIRTAGRARILNSTSPTITQLPEPDIADMEFFLVQILMVMPVLGFGFTQPPPTLQPTAVYAKHGSQASPFFVMNYVGTSASAQELDGEFIVLKGSTARRQGVDSWNSYRSLRDQLIAEGKIIDGPQESLLLFAEDVPFSSPSAAASVVYGGNQNGRLVWKTRDTGETYQQWQQKKLDASVSQPGQIDAGDEED